MFSRSSLLICLPAGAAAGAAGGAGAVAGASVFAGSVAAAVAGAVASAGLEASAGAAGAAGAWLVLVVNIISVRGSSASSRTGLLSLGGLGSRRSCLRLGLGGLGWLRRGRSIRSSGLSCALSVRVLDTRAFPSRVVQDADDPGDKEHTGRDSRRSGLSLCSLGSGCSGGSRLRLGRLVFGGLSVGFLLLEDGLELGLQVIKGVDGC